jgi:hypothetical protein
MWVLPRTEVFGIGVLSDLYASLNGLVTVIDSEDSPLGDG